jgi:hypothetical protein
LVKKFEAGTRVFIQHDRMDPDIYADAFIEEVRKLGGVYGTIKTGEFDYSNEVEVRLDFSLESLKCNTDVFLSPTTFATEKSSGILDALDKEIADRESQLAKLKEARVIVADLL